MGTPARRGPVRHCSHAQASPLGHGAGRGQQFRRTWIRRHSAYPLNTVGDVDGLSWLLVMSRNGYPFLLMLGSCVATPGTHALTRGLAYSQGSGQAEPSPEGSGKAELLPKGSGEVEPSPERSGEPGPAPEG
jgi:hypothetical protein